MCLHIEPADGFAALARVETCQRELQSVQAHIRKLVRTGPSRQALFECSLSECW